MTEARLRDRPARGWTLIELMLVLALTGLMTAWALPGGGALLQRAQRSQARLTMLQLAHWLERYASAQGRYPATLPVTTWDPSGLSYQITYTGDANTYTLLALPSRSQADDPCGTLSLDHLGHRGVRQSRWTSEACWTR